MSDQGKYTVGSGNVFHDLGLPDAEDLKVKAELAYEISMIIEERGLKQAEAAEVLGVDQPKISALVRGRLEGFSMERLYRFLNALGRDVQIVVQPKPRGRKAATLSVIRTAPARRGVRRTAKT
jgi:predicted XRE-type DNA-binding protein